MLVLDAAVVAVVLNDGNFRKEDDLDENARIVCFSLARFDFDLISVVVASSSLLLLLTCISTVVLDKRVKLSIVDVSSSNCCCFSDDNDNSIDWSDDAAITSFLPFDNDDAE